MLINANDIYQVLLASLKVQADKYKIIIDADMPHSERKDLDTEIKQMYELLSQMTNSTIILSSAEIESLKSQFDLKLQELQSILDNPNITTVKGDNGLSSYELALENGFVGTEIEYLESLKGQNGLSLTFDSLTTEEKELLKGQDGLSSYELALENGFVGTEIEYLESLKGQNGLSLTFDSLTTEEKESLKGQNGLSSYELALENGFVGTEIEYLESLKGQNGLSLTFNSLTTEEKESLKGQSFTYDMFTPEQLQQIANLVNITPFDSTSILDRLTAIETALSIVPPIPEPNYFYPKPFVTDIVHDYDTSPYTMTISAGYYESEMIDLVESEYINHVIKTNWNVLNWNTNPITVDISCVVSDGLLENPLEGNCVACNFRFERAFDGVVRVSGGAHYMGQYDEFPPQMATDFVWVENENDMLKISLHTDPMGIIKDTFYEMFGTDKLFYKFDIIASSVAPLVLAETPITETVERWSLQ
ncbi:MAG: hypothetical protein PHG81_12940 [Aliarcobacter sp.]|nr:hypothetical protein [Aliarcobacter sp.]